MRAPARKSTASDLIPKECDGMKVTINYYQD
jgi:hypothetical protein